MTKKPSRSGCIGILVAAGLICCYGCKKNEKPQAPPPPPPAVKTLKPVQKQPSSAKIAASTSGGLDFSTKKDPFKPYVEPNPQGKPIPVARGRVRTEDLLPIQRYDVEKFKISGIIAGIRENTALITDPTGKGYVVKEGMPIGNNDGHIRKIHPSSVEVVEQYRDDNGHNHKRTIMLTLAKKK